METTVAKVSNNVKINNSQTVQQSKDTNMVSDVESFKNTLKDLDVTSDVKTNTDVNNETKNNTLNKSDANEVQAKNQNTNTMSNQVTEEVSVANDSVLSQQEVEKQLLVQKGLQDILQPVNETGVLPQVSQVVQQMQGLPNDIKDKKNSKLFEIGVSKEHNPLLDADENLKILDDTLRAVSAENIAKQNPEINDKILNIQNEVQTSVIAALDINKTADNKMALESLSELNSKISAINSINTISAKTKAALGAIKMNKEDANFFVNMVENQNNNVFQANITINADKQVVLNDVKAQVVQSSAAVSQALIDKLQESMKTNKAFRVDFDNNVAVIMRVDSNGVLSANFIPGSSAVEQYLRNNIAELRQNFESKGLEYNELSYSSRKNNQQKQQNRNQKGGRDE